MTGQEVVEILRAHGNALGAPDQAGRIRIGIRGTDTSIEIEHGPELWDLAEGKIPPEEVLTRIATAPRR